jgi:TRAP-type C4-dicarboxylate transport system permease small subunit
MASAFLLGFFAWYAADMVITSYQINDVSQGLVAVPLWVPQSGMALGLTIMTIALLDDLVTVFRRGTPSYLAAEREKKIAMSENI